MTPRVLINKDKPHAHIAQTPRKTRTTGGITRAYTLKIKFSALRGTRGQRGSEMRAKNAHLEKSGGMHSASNRTRIAARITQKHRMSSHRRRDNAPSQLKVHVIRAAGSHRSARRRNARGHGFEKTRIMRNAKNRTKMMPQHRAITHKRADNAPV
jgi:hypothetical protein